MSTTPSYPLPVRFGRWLLRLDEPVPPRTEAQLAAEVERNYRWNFWFNLLDGSSFQLGATFASSSTILPFFISQLTTSTLPLGILAVIAQAGWYLPQLFTANAVEQLPRKKAVVVNLGLFLERLPCWVFALAPLLALRSYSLALIVFMVGLAWHVVGAGVVAIAWQDFIARVFPVERRGRFFGLTNFLGTGLGVIGSALSARLLAAVAFPYNFFYCFLICASLIALSWVFLALTREPVQPVTAPRRNDREYWQALPQILRQDHNFRRFLLVRMLMALGGMGNGFIAVAAVHRWQVPTSTAGLYTGALLLGQAIGTLAFGFLADRFGHKRNLVLGAAASCGVFALAWLAPAPAWYFAVFVLQGIAYAAGLVSGILITLEFCVPERRPTYLGLANTGIGLASVVAPLLGAALAAQSYNLLFALSAGVALLALTLMQSWVKEPRWDTHPAPPEAV